MLGSTAVDVAHFLRDDDRLDKAVVGDFLGDPEA